MAWDDDPDRLHETTCVECGLEMRASDAQMLDWGKRNHEAVCGLPTPLPFAGIISGMTEEHDEFECNVLCWLVGHYGPPGFRFFRRNGTQIVVT